MRGSSMERMVKQVKVKGMGLKEWEYYFREREIRTKWTSTRTDGVEWKADESN